MTDRTHHHCQCDNCDGEDCKDLPVAPQLKGASTKELVDELRGRLRVNEICCRSGEIFVVAHGNASSYFDEGKSTILVVKE